MDPSVALERIRSISGNQRALETLQELLEAGTAIAFVGAGASAGLYPMWTSLVTLLAKEAVDRGLATAQERDYWLRLADQDPQQAVQWIKRTLSRQIIGAFLRHRFGPPQPPGSPGHTPLHEALLRLPFRGYVTTNYDIGLSLARSAVHAGARADHQTTWKDRDSLHRWLTGDIFGEQQWPVLHVHGVYDRSETIVLTVDEYREAYRDALYAQAFGKLWAQDHLVFLGVGFRDKWVDFVVDAVVSQTAGRAAGEPRHLAVIGLRDSEPYVPDMRRHFQDVYNANVVFYPIETVVQGGATREDHFALQALLDSLIRRVKGAVPPPPGPPGSPSSAGRPAPPASGGEAAALTPSMATTALSRSDLGGPGGEPTPELSSLTTPSHTEAVSSVATRTWTTAALQQELEAVLLAPYELEMVAEDAGFPSARLPNQGSMEERIRAVIKLCQGDGVLKGFLRQVGERYPRRKMPVLEAVLQDSNV